MCYAAGTIMHEVILTIKNMATKIKKLNDKAVVPTRANESDSGWDVTITNISSIKGDVIWFGTGIAITPPGGHYFEIYPRSSMSKTPFMFPHSVAIIDETYTGELIIPIRVLHPNVGLSKERDIYPSGMIMALDAKPTSMSEVANLILSKYPKIAQMILKKRINTFFEEVESLENTDRGANGFGSSGQK